MVLQTTNIPPSAAFEYLSVANFIERSFHHSHPPTSLQTLRAVEKIGTQIGAPFAWANSDAGGFCEPPDALTDNTFCTKPARRIGQFDTETSDGRYPEPAQVGIPARWGRGTDHKNILSTYRSKINILNFQLTRTAGNAQPKR